jgi:hypothetical protein
MEEDRMKRPKSNKSAKALKVHVLTYFGAIEAHADKSSADRQAAIDRVNTGKPQTVSTGYLIRADQLPAIVEAMAKGLHKVQWRHSWRSVSPVAKEALRRYTRAQFKTIGIDAKEGV